MVAPNAFGVTADIVRSDFFPHLASFSATSNPTSSSVARGISQSAGYLQGLLDDKNIDTNAIAD